MERGNQNTSTFFRSHNRHGSNFQIKAARNDNDLRTGEVTKGNYFIHLDSSNTLKGIYYENVTTSEVEVKNALRVLVELNSPTSG
jgi:hypothetical protein